jgi:hypothetical protein
MDKDKIIELLGSTDCQNRKIAYTMIRHLRLSFRDLVSLLSEYISKYMDSSPEISVYSNSVIIAMSLFKIDLESDQFNDTGQDWNYIRCNVKRPRRIKQGEIGFHWLETWTLHDICKELGVPFETNYNTTV